MTIRKHLATTVVALLTLTFSLGAAADWQAEEGNRLQQRAEKAIEKVRTKVERSHPYFEDAYAMAVWPGITRIAAGFGGAYGKNFALIIFFKDKEALEGLKRNDTQFTGQAGIDIVTFGAAGTPAYNEGVALIPLTNLGLMAEFSAAGVWFRYKPYSD
jgi:hypothetical protein